MPDWDLIVVGAGPGGAVAARTAAQAGLRTLLLERGRRPGEKNASGCGLGPRMWRAFDFMAELTPAVCPSMREGSVVCPSLREGRAIRHHLVDASGRVVTRLMTRPTASVGYEPAQRFITMNVYRSDFDPWLAGLATAAGAELRTSTLITDLHREGGRVAGVVDEHGEVLRAPLVIGADGVLSTVARTAGIRERWRRDEVVLVPQLDFACDPARIDDVLDDETLACWWGVDFPAAYQVFFRDGFHIGLGNWLDAWEQDALAPLRHLVGLPDFSRLIRQLGARPRELQVHLLPWLTDPGRTYGQGVMLVGDAGGFPCPLEAEGVYQAMETGRIAAEVAAEALGAGDPSAAFLARYETRWRASSTGIEFQAGAELARLWRALPFSPEENMSWFIPMVSELLGGIFDWSEPHAVRLQQVARHLQGYAPQALPFFERDVVPLLGVALGDEIRAATSWRGLMRLASLALRLRRAAR
ncbi:MAG: NAD(P)/FAD-dependent oxidoreductase [Pseudomonadota bacterium]